MPRRNSVQKSMCKLARIALLTLFIDSIEIDSLVAQSPSLGAVEPTQESIDAQWQKAWDNMIQSNGKGWNIELPTLGGKQFWTDYRWWDGYRVQYNHTLDHWRLIDASSIRKGWGSKEAMIDLLEQIKAQKQGGDQGGLGEQRELDEVYLLLHGLMRTASSMKPIEQEILKQSGDRKLDFERGSKRIIRLQYASTRASIVSHAQAFRELVENLPGKPRIKIAGHSLGNIVVRLAIAQWKEQGDPRGVLARMDRVVMMGPPNQGSSFAKRLSQLGLFEMITGSAGMQLGPQWDGLRSDLGIPPCPFKIIAGDLTGTSIHNPLLSGPNDAVVTVEETKLEGMSEHQVFPVLHSFLMQDARCVESGVKFLLGESP